MDALGVESFSFTNLGHEPGDFSPSIVDYEFLRGVLSHHDGAVIALGGEVSRILKRCGVKHIRAPHPSSRNRKFNDPDYEPAMLASLREALAKHEDPHHGV